MAILNYQGYTLRETMKTGEIMQLFETPEIHCPYCNHLFTACSSYGAQGTPSEGDISICINCAELLVFGSNLSLEKLSVVVLAQLAVSDPEVYRSLLAQQDMVRQLSEGGSNE